MGAAAVGGEVEGALLVMVWSLALEHIEHMCEVAVRAGWVKE